MAAKRIFLGQLRAPELEMLADNIRPTVMSLLFFLTIFRTSFNASFMTAVVLLLFCKAAHWLAEARVSAMESSPSDSTVTHVRLASMISLLFFVDQAVVWWAAVRTYSGGPSLLLLFGFEFCILAVSAASNMVMFILNLISIKQEQAWHAKGTYVLYLEFLSSALQSLIYLCFFFIIFRYYGLPLHIIRSMYMTFASFQRSLAKLLTYRRAVSGMDARYPDASSEDLQNVDSTCIVCRDVMETGKKLPCGHILHLECLRSWLQQDPTCPLCRKSVLIEELYRTDAQQYAAEYARFINARRGGALNNQNQHHHNHHHHRFPNNNNNNNNNNRMDFEREILQEHLNERDLHFQDHNNQHQQRHDDVAGEANIRSNADIAALVEKVEGLRSQMDFIQSLLISSLELQQQQLSARQQQEQKDKEKEEEKHAQLKEEELRAKRLQFYK